VLISIITPTWQRGNLDILRRCLISVMRQTYGNFEHIVASDGGEEIAVHTVVNELGDPRLHYYTTRKHHGGWGAGVRQEVMEIALPRYFVFLDDDNILFPTYLEKMLGALRSAPQARFAICEELHFGPLQPFHGPPPVVLSGVPKLYHIDTLQVMVEAKAMREVGWVSNSYFADGETYAELARRYQYVNIPECLCAHL